MRGKSYTVTKPLLPPLDEFLPYLVNIWSSAILTNKGPYHEDFEQQLANYLGVPFVSLFSSGTLALLTAMKVLKVQGEVITTPYSFVATAHTIIWNGASPVFVDIDKDTFNIDPKKIEAAITEDTTAIVPVHCYGNPAKVKEIEEIANRFDLKVIYDAAPAFDVKHKQTNENLLNSGDLSAISFHATKVFNTFEGGAIVTKDASQKAEIDKLRNFGFLNEITVEGTGINGKLSEVHAAFGILQLKYIRDSITKRMIIDDTYRSELNGIEEISIYEYNSAYTPNYSYFPILISENASCSRDDLYFYLKSRDINSRRYFYPLISEFPAYRNLESSNKSNLPIANSISNNVICLPIYPELTEKDVKYIAKVIRNFFCV